jgi:hypothetical protein
MERDTVTLAAFPPESLDLDKRMHNREIPAVTLFLTVANMEMPRSSETALTDRTVTSMAGLYALTTLPFFVIPLVALRVSMTS